MKLCHTATVFVFSLAAVQFQSKLTAITVKAAFGTFLHFLVLFAGTRAARVQTGGQTGLSAPPSPNVPADTKTLSLAIAKHPGGMRKEAGLVSEGRGRLFLLHKWITFSEHVS